ncbi:glycine cleavage system H protein [Saccharopolyspora lacisalsi]|uniref:Glycine cleavage system H protein n=1 Tax=Halosaccharopolyspora lacisalsi TaxID=1000566 RepID=A0A839DYY7_9PSEU|nr:glycine cleavage system protein GcvH [Halosaccharopolyspora lacisalsi]MBA8824431.1 glycine cleavage system H protein [Halosaccharopolyspora lacisalsi]
MAPEGTRYTREHEWVSPTGRDTVRIGITDYAQQQLGDVVFVDLPQVGERLTESATIGEVESTKSVSDLYAPVAGEVVARNELLDDRPELVNTQPYGDGWMVELRLDDSGALENLLDEAAYRTVLEQG